MFKYVKHLAYPVNITKKDLKMAKLIVTQFGGPAGELGATLRYFSQKFTMPDEMGRALLNDIATGRTGSHGNGSYNSSSTYEKCYN